MYCHHNDSVVLYVVLMKLVLSVCRYEVKFQNGQECGGAYLKLLTADDNLDLVSLIF